jgi:hypothetical protein
MGHSRCAGRTETRENAGLGKTLVMRELALVPKMSRREAPNTRRARATTDSGENTRIPISFHSNRNGRALVASKPKERLRDVIDRRPAATHPVLRAIVPQYRRSEPELQHSAR